MSTANKHKTAQEGISLQLNSNLQPLYADQVFQIAIENNVAKLLLGHKINQNSAVHTITLTLPMSGLLTLSDTLNKIFEDTNFQNNYVEDLEKHIVEVKNRFDQS
ncbi:hypothetical protein NQ661_13260 [Acinetobacter baumannii]|uniref:hypothetical protein n=1 Tax=Acinetobacter baumannii TaxID=470 RepID=UPI001C0D22C1|nr:hypothetical protein [Acinetobacter baumannii]EHU1490360.1 hypothetical protein [Acinetobacter baumannii]MBU3081213.1 hypothetical protein [Acinetobacter baumannii]MDC4324871.1 hypothetical protein [Acinetobacter baumannii]MDC4558787.1 hypothetical protein [Acinetobacter baumannii]MDC5388532.1 hypothetical protein [Acinetobacter baumannii]